MQEWILPMMIIFKDLDYMEMIILNDYGDDDDESGDEEYKEWLVLRDRRVYNTVDTIGSLYVSG